MSGHYSYYYRAILTLVWASSEVAEVCNLTVLVLDTMLMDFVAVDGEDGGLLARDTLFLMVFFPVEEDDFLCMLFLFHNGVQMTLFLDVSGVILELGGVLLLLGGDVNGGGLPDTPVASS